MFRKVALSVVFVLTVGLCVEVIGLATLQHHRSSYADYWKQRTKQATGSDSFIYVALGDSVAQGLGASQPETGYVSQIAQLLASRTGKRIHVVNLSVTGAKLQDVIDTQLPELKKYRPDLLTLDIGANDMGSFDAVRFADQFSRIASMLPTNSLVANVPYAAGRTRFNANARAANALISLGTRHNNLPVVDMYDVLASQQSPWIYAADFYHPNDRGYVIWTHAFWKEIQTNLSLL